MKIILQSWLILLLLGNVSAQSPGGAGIFREIPPAESGIRWKHTDPRSQQRYLPETFPPGVAIFDYNNDGLMDIFLVNSGESSFFHPPRPSHAALYRNNGDGTFTDVSEKAGLTANVFGMGVAVGDYDGDGYPDLLLTGYGSAILYHNNANGTFTDVTAQSGIHETGWTTSAVWFDYNNDGNLDLFIEQYADYSRLKVCDLSNAYGSHPGDVADSADKNTYYCTPRIFKSMPSHLYRNDGGGHFTDVSQETGIGEFHGKGLGVVATDINNDGYMDLFVANDTLANFLFVNRGGKRFEEIGLQANVAYGENGLARSGMGVDASDFDGDGRQDLFVANLDQETFSIYHNEGDETFEDQSRNLGIANATRLLSGWGMRFFDYDNDGLPDLILANGHYNDMIANHMTAVTYQEPLLLFHNEGKNKMSNVSASGGDAFRRLYAARGLAVGDLNNDGYPDVLVGIIGDTPLLLYNNALSKNHWVGLKLVGKRANRDAIGAVLRWSCGGQVHSKLKSGGGSYLSSHDPREILGMGKCMKMDWVEIHWPQPSSHVERLTTVPIDQYSTVVEGQGILGK